MAINYQISARDNQGNLRRIDTGDNPYYFELIGSGRYHKVIADVYQETGIKLVKPILALVKYNEHILA